MLLATVVVRFFDYDYDYDNEHEHEHERINRSAKEVRNNRKSRKQVCNMLPRLALVADRQGLSLTNQGVEGRHPCSGFAWRVISAVTAARGSAPSNNTRNTSWVMGMSTSCLSASSWAERLVRMPSATIFDPPVI